MIDAPSPWTHDSGRRLNYDGAHIRYTHPSGLEAYIEACHDPEEGRLEYRPAIFEGGQMIEYPPRLYDKDAAIERLEEMMSDHADAGAEATASA